MGGYMAKNTAAYFMLYNIEADFIRPEYKSYC